MAGLFGSDQNVGPVSSGQQYAQSLDQAQQRQADAAATPGGNFLNALNKVMMFGQGNIGGIINSIHEENARRANYQAAQQIYQDLPKFMTKAGSPLPDDDVKALKGLADTGQLGALTSKFNFELSKLNQQKNIQDKQKLQEATAQFVQNNPVIAHNPESAQLIQALMSVNPQAAVAEAQRLTSQDRTARRQATTDQLQEVNTGISEANDQVKAGKPAMKALDQLKAKGGDISQLSPGNQALLAPYQPQVEAKLNQSKMTSQQPGMFDVVGNINRLLSGTTTASPEQIAQVHAAVNPDIQQAQAAQKNKKALIQQKKQLQQQKQQIDMGGAINQDTSQAEGANLTPYQLYLQNHGGGQ